MRLKEQAETKSRKETEQVMQQQLEAAVIKHTEASKQINDLQKEFERVRTESKTA